MNQLEFNFPTARSTDHISSFEAADRLIKSGKLSQKMETVLIALRDYIRWHDNQLPTSKKLAAWAGLDRHDVARRLPNLEKYKVVKKIEIEGLELLWRPL